MILEILACIGIYNLVKGINITIESSENERNFMAHMNRYWEDKIRMNNQTKDDVWNTVAGRFYYTC